MNNSKTINIYSNIDVIRLKEQTYQVWLLGGHWVDLSGFSIRLIEIKTGINTNSTESFLKWQGYDFKKFSKRILDLKVKQDGDYRVEFINSDNIKVKLINLWPFTLFTPEIPNDRLEVFFRGNY